MAQPSPSVQPNGVPSPAPVADAVGTPDSTLAAVPVKRKREDGETRMDDAEMRMDVDDDKPSLVDLKDSPSLIRDYITVITRYATLYPPSPTPLLSTMMRTRDLPVAASLICPPLLMLIRQL